MGCVLRAQDILRIYTISKRFAKYVVVLSLGLLVPEAPLDGLRYTADYLWLPRGRRGGGAGDWVFGISRRQLLCTRIYTQYPVISHNVDEDAKVHMCNGITSLRSRNGHNVVSSLYVSKT